jgi:hypothetical protein
MARRKKKMTKKLKGILRRDIQRLRDHCEYIEGLSAESRLYQWAVMIQNCKILSSILDDYGVPK